MISADFGTPPPPPPPPRRPPRREEQAPNLVFGRILRSIFEVRFFNSPKIVMAPAQRPRPRTMGVNLHSGKWGLQKLINRCFEIQRWCLFLSSDTHTPAPGLPCSGLLPDALDVVSMAPSTLYWTNFPFIYFAMLHPPTRLVVYCT